MPETITTNQVRVIATL